MPFGWLQWIYCFHSTRIQLSPSSASVFYDSKKIETMIYFLDTIYVSFLLFVTTVIDLSFLTRVLNHSLAPFNIVYRSEILICAPIMLWSFSPSEVRQAFLATLVCIDTKSTQAFFSYACMIVEFLEQSTSPLTTLPVVPPPMFMSYLIRHLHPTKINDLQLRFHLYSADVTYIISFLLSTSIN